MFGVTLASSSGPSLPFYNTGTGTVSLAAGATFLVGGVESEAQLAALLGSLSNAAAVVDLGGTLLNAGAELTASGLLNDVLLNDVVVGGTINTGTGTIGLFYPTLDAVTYQGTLALTYDTRVSIINGITLENAAGTEPGAVAIAASNASLYFLDSETLSNATVSINGFRDLLSFSTLTLAPSLAVNVQGSGGRSVSGNLAGATLINDGTIAALGTQATLEIDTASFINNGIINVGSGDLLDLEEQYNYLSGAQPFALSGTGAIALAPGSTLEIGGIETTAQLMALIGSLVGTVTGVVIELDGTIVNTGTTLAITPTGSLSDVVLNASVIGGTIVSAGGSLAVTGGEFDGVTYDGVLALTGTHDRLEVSGGLDIQTASGGLPGTLDLAGVYNVITVLTYGTVGGSLVVGSLETLSNLVIEGNGSLVAIIGPPTGTLSIASSVISTATGTIGFGAQTILNAGTFVVAASAALGFEADDFINTGTVIVEAGGAFGYTSIDPEETFTNLGSIEIASGGSLGIGGTLTPGGFETIVGSLVGATPGVLVAFGIGTLVNTGTVFEVMPTGSLSNMLIGDAMVLGGTLIDAGTLNFAEATVFDAVTYVGAVELGVPDTSVTFAGASSVTSGSSAPDIIAAVGTYDSVTFSPGGTLTSFTAPLPGVTSQEFDNLQIVIGLPGTQSNNDLLMVTGGGTVTFGATTTIVTGTGAEIEVTPGTAGNSTLVNAGTIVDASGLEIFSETSDGDYTAAGTSAFINKGLIVASYGTVPAPVYDSLMTIYGTFANAGTIALSGTHAAYVQSTSFYNTGLVELAAGANLDFEVLPTLAGVIAMADGAEQVQSAGTGDFLATIADFSVGDTIDLESVTLYRHRLAGGHRDLCRQCAGGFPGHHDGGDDRAAEFCLCGNVVLGRRRRGAHRHRDHHHAGAHRPAAAAALLPRRHPHPHRARRGCGRESGGRRCGADPRRWRRGRWCGSAIGGSTACVIRGRSRCCRCAVRAGAFGVGLPARDLRAVARSQPVSSMAC